MYKKYIALVAVLSSIGSLDSMQRLVIGVLQGARPVRVRCMGRLSVVSDILRDNKSRSAQLAAIESELNRLRADEKYHKMVKAAQFSYVAGDKRSIVEILEDINKKIKALENFKKSLTKNPTN